MGQSLSSAQLGIDTRVRGDRRCFVDARRESLVSGSSRALASESAKGPVLVDDIRIDHLTFAYFKKVRLQYDGAYANDVADQFSTLLWQDRYEATGPPELFIVSRSPMELELGIPVRRRSKRSVLMSSAT